MIDVIGYIKVNENAPERIDYFLASLQSLSYLNQTNATLRIALDTPSKKLYRCAQNILDSIGRPYTLARVLDEDKERCYYGQIYSHLLGLGSNPYVLNFIEDHFSILQSDICLAKILDRMYDFEVDICKASFFEIEQKSSKLLDPVHDDSYGKVFDNTPRNHAAYQSYYGHRYYIGVNFITTRDFAKRFWGRNIYSHKPHSFEISKYDAQWAHRCMIPNIEILAAIDDDHGEPGSCLLNRKDEFFWDIYNSIRL